MSVYDDKPLKDWPYLEVHDWDKHQPFRGDRAKYIRIEPAVLDRGKFSQLNNAEFGLLVRLWLVRGRSGASLHRDPTKAVASTGQVRTKYTASQLERLEYLGFLKPTRRQDTPNENENENENENDTPNPSATPGRRTYPDGFKRAWEAYPHHDSRSVKAEAAKQWRRLGLEPLTDRVLLWIEALAASDDWTRDDGQYVPGMQVWIKRPDFTDDPPPAKGRQGSLPPPPELCAACGELPRLGSLEICGKCHAERKRGANPERGESGPRLAVVERSDGKRTTGRQTAQRASQDNQESG